jgi:hypothetical protein
MISQLDAVGARSLTQYFPATNQSRPIRVASGMYADVVGRLYSLVLITGARAASPWPIVLRTGAARKTGVACCIPYSCKYCRGMVEGRRRGSEKGGSRWLSLGVVVRWCQTADRQKGYLMYHVGTVRRVAKLRRERGHGDDGYLPLTRNAIPGCRYPRKMSTQRAKLPCGWAVATYSPLPGEALS